jgi:hypothetical protein
MFFAEHGWYENHDPSKIRSFQLTKVNDLAIFSLSYFRELCSLQNMDGMKTMILQDSAHH